MEYSTYWSILETPSKSIQSNSICLYIAIGAGLLWFISKKFQTDKGDGEKTIILWSTGVFSVLGLIAYITLTFFIQDKSNEKTLEMLNSPTTPRIEGVVSNFERKFRNTRAGGETTEIFTVDSVQFAYSDAALGKFNSFSQTYNNVIFNGQQVRITYRSDSQYGEYTTILKIEIAK